jgi:IclR-like helix-turn-helix domain-containing protein
MAGNAADQGRSVTAKLAGILRSFNSGSVHQLHELARRNGLPMSTTHRLTVELTATDFLQRIPEGGFRIGPAVRDLSDPTPRPRRSRWRSGTWRRRRSRQWPRR